MRGKAVSAINVLYGFQTRAKPGGDTRPIWQAGKKTDEAILNFFAKGNQANKEALREGRRVPDNSCAKIDKSFCTWKKFPHNKGSEEEAKRKGERDTKDRRGEDGGDSEEERRGEKTKWRRIVGKQTVPERTNTARETDEEKERERGEKRREGERKKANTAGERGPPPKDSLKELSLIHI